MKPSCCAAHEDQFFKENNFSVMTEIQMREFIVCSECGNKRCPKASHCSQKCTNSNKPGQKGSFYGPQEWWSVDGVSMIL